MEEGVTISTWSGKVTSGGVNDRMGGDEGGEISFGEDKNLNLTLSPVKGAPRAGFEPERNPRPDASPHSSDEEASPAKVCCWRFLPNFLCSACLSADRSRVGTNGSGALRVLLTCGDDSTEAAEEDAAEE